MKGVSAQWNIFSLFQTPSIPLGRGFEKEKISGSAIRKNENNILGLKLVVQQKGSIIVILRNIQRFSSSHDVILYIKELLTALNYNPDIPAKKFEDSLQHIGAFLGFAAMSPEKETGNGPDGLWCLSDGTYLILEAKSRAVHAEISRDNINQLLGSVEWFKRYYPNEPYVAVTLQQVNIKGTNVNISDETRVIDLDTLEMLKSNIIAFTNALYERSGKVNLDASKLKAYLLEYRLTTNDFKKSYLKEISNKK